jgi:uncharacterized 2Fe-2S/4Fe-4S cluster protein (DUF4445 family)
MAVGLAVDVGSTTLAAYLCDLRTGELLATATDMNPQVTYGDDIMSRISYANEEPRGRERLHRAVIRAINELAREATRQVGLSVKDIVDMTLVGNSVMHHLALNLNPRALGVAPFIPVVEEPVDIEAADIGLRFHPAARLHVLPLEAGFVGADNVGVILSEQPHRQDEIMLVIDVGTNGELLLGNRERLLCTSSPTGPALEGAQITHGMRAAPGAIERVRIDPKTQEVRFKVIGEDRWSDEMPTEEIQARGICGSGIIEAVPEMFAAGIITASGRFARNLTTPRLTEIEGLKAFVLAEAEQTATGSPIVVSQRDVRNIQLAKASLYVAAQLLMQELGVETVDRIVLAGAFGNVIDPYYALALGMIPPCPLAKITSAGNAAGDGAVGIGFVGGGVGVDVVSAVHEHQAAQLAQAGLVLAENAFGDLRRHRPVVRRLDGVHPRREDADDGGDPHEKQTDGDENLHQPETLLTLGCVAFHGIPPFRGGDRRSRAAARFRNPAVVYDAGGWVTQL